MNIIIFLLFSCMFALNLYGTILEFTLSLRDTHDAPILLVFVFIGTVFVAISRLTNPNLFELVSGNFFRFKSIEKSYNEELRLGILSRFLMSLNFIFSFSLCSYLILRDQVDSTFDVELSLCISVVYYSIISWGHNIVKLFYDSTLFFDNLSFIGRSHINFVGLFFLIFSLIWVLNPVLSTMLITFFISIVSFLHIIRIFKGLNFCFLENIKWYYLILYLCAVEFLPFMVLAKILIIKSIQ